MGQKHLARQKKYLRSDALITKIANFVDLVVVAGAVVFVVLVGAVIQAGAVVEPGAVIQAVSWS